MDLRADRPVLYNKCPAPLDIVRHVLALNDDSGSASRFGSFSCAIYDTAWLSMISRSELGNDRPVFPECFDFLLNHQQNDGKWASNGSQVDGILSNLAGLLALASRYRLKGGDLNETQSLTQRLETSQSVTRALLQDWNVSQSVHVGFEILIPSLLQQLEVYNIHFDFPGSLDLKRLRDQKLGKFDPKTIYAKHPTTLLHSLEALVGLIDFDKISHHCHEGYGMFGSPAATAAYLINSSSWDDLAEKYLKSVITAYGDTGAIPSAYPTCLFEISWTLSTLLAPEITSHKLDQPSEQRLGQLLEESLNQQDGVIGFAPGILEDADDTARALIALKFLGRPRSPCKMIKSFQTEQHYRTYKLEGSPSFSANCNILLSLLEYDEIQGYEDDIAKAIVFLLQVERSGPIIDKWNLSPQYSRMLFVQTLISILKNYNSGRLKSLATAVVHDEIIGSICRLLSQTLSSQNNDGSWANSLEITAYSILTISYCLSLPWPMDFKSRLEESILSGREVLYQKYADTEKLDYLWIEKVSYRSSLLYATYCSAALHIMPLDYAWGDPICESFSLKSEAKKQIAHLFSSLPLLRGSRLLLTDLILIEANQVSRRLIRFRDILFSRDNIPMTADKYIEFIPMIWLACNYKNKHPLSANTVWEMVLLSLLNFQVDEFMESVVAKIDESKSLLLLTLLREECYRISNNNVAAIYTIAKDENSPSPWKKRKRNNSSAEAIDANGLDDAAVKSAFKTLSRFIEHFNQHWAILQSPESVQQEVARQIYVFLAAHITHNLDNVSLAKTRKVRTNSDLGLVGHRQSYHEWVRTVASDDTSCPLSFLVFSCLISERERNCFESARAHYLSTSLCRHLATMCRQYNDYGSATRDAEECNLNSLDFPEFQDFKSQVIGFDQRSNGYRSIEGSNVSPLAKLREGNGVSEEMERQADHRAPDESNGDGAKAGTSNNLIRSSSMVRAMDDLMAIATFERLCMQLALKELTQITSPTVMRQLRVFIDVTDMFGQIYVQRDIASRVMDTSSASSPN